MKNLKQRSRNVLGRRLSGGVTAGSLALTVVLALAAALLVLPATARAASQQQLPFRCFAQVSVDHVVFGPDSFFLPNTQQGSTSFTENAGPTTVTYPLYLHCLTRNLTLRSSRNTPSGIMVAFSTLPPLQQFLLTEMTGSPSHAFQKSDSG